MNDISRTGGYEEEPFGTLPEDSHALATDDILNGGVPIS